MVSIEVFGKLVVEPKTLGLGILFGKIFENVFEHFGVVATPLKCFTNGFINMVLDKGDEGVGGFLKNGIVYKCSPNQLFPCNHITPVWDGA
jgi:hypothetical protein